MYKYQLISVIRETPEITREFESEHSDCDIDHYGDHVPFAVGSNQYIKMISDCD